MRDVGGVEAERAEVDDRKRDVRNPPVSRGRGRGAGGRGGRTRTHWRMSRGGFSGWKDAEVKKDDLGKEEEGVDGLDEEGVS